MGCCASKIADPIGASPAEMVAPTDVGKKKGITIETPDAEYIQRSCKTALELLEQNPHPNNEIQRQLVKIFAKFDRMAFCFLAKLGENSDFESPNSEAKMAHSEDVAADLEAQRATLKQQEEDVKAHAAMLERKERDLMEFQKQLDAEREKQEKRRRHAESSEEEEEEHLEKERRSSASSYDEEEDQSRSGSRSRSRSGSADSTSSEGSFRSPPEHHDSMIDLRGPLDEIKEESEVTDHDDDPVVVIGGPGSRKPDSFTLGHSKLRVTSADSASSWDLGDAMQELDEEQNELSASMTRMQSLRENIAIIRQHSMLGERPSDLSFDETFNSDESEDDVVTHEKEETAQEESTPDDKSTPGDQDKPKDGPNLPDSDMKWVSEAGESSEGEDNEETQRQFRAEMAALNAHRESGASSGSEVEAEEKKRTFSWSDIIHVSSKRSMQKSESQQSGLSAKELLAEVERERVEEKRLAEEERLAQEETSSEDGDEEEEVEVEIGREEEEEEEEEEGVMDLKDIPRKLMRVGSRMQRRMKTSPKSPLQKVDSFASYMTTNTIATNIVLAFDNDPNSLEAPPCAPMPEAGGPMLDMIDFAPSSDNSTDESDAQTDAESVDDLALKDEMELQSSLRSTERKMALPDQEARTVSWNVNTPVSLPSARGYLSGNETEEEEEEPEAETVKSKSMLHHVVKHLEVDKRRLELKLEDVSSQMRCLERDKSSLQKNLDDLSEQLKAKQAENSALHSAEVAASQKVLAIALQLEKVAGDSFDAGAFGIDDPEINVLAEEKRKLKEQLAALELKLADSEQKVSQLPLLHHEIDDLKSRAQHRKEIQEKDLEAIMELKSSLEERGQETRQLKDSLMKIDSAVKEKDLMISQLREIVKEKEDEVDNLLVAKQLVVQGEMQRKNSEDEMKRLMDGVLSRQASDSDLLAEIKTLEEAKLEISHQLIESQNAESKMREDVVQLQRDLSKAAKENDLLSEKSGAFAVKVELLEAKTASLKDETSSLEKELDDVKNSLMESEIEREKLCEQYEDAKEELATVQGELTALLDEQRALRKRLSSRDLSAEGGQIDLLNAQLELEKTQKKLAESVEECETLKENIESIKFREQTLHADLSDAKEDLQTAKGRIEVLEVELQRAVARAESAEAERVDATNELMQCRLEIASPSGDEEEEEEEEEVEVIALKEDQPVKFRTLKRALSKAALDHDSASTRVKDLQEKLEAQEKQLVQLQQEVQAKDQKVVALLFEKGTLENTVEELEADLKAEKEENTKCSDELDEALTRDETLTAKIASLENSLSKAREGNAEALEERDALAGKLADAKAVMNDLRADKAELRARLSKVEQSKEALEAKLEKASKKLEKAVHSAAEMEAQFHASEDRLSELIVERESLREQIVKFTEESTSLNESLRKARQDLQQKEAKLSQVTAQRDELEETIRNDTRDATIRNLENSVSDSRKEVDSLKKKLELKEQELEETAGFRARHKDAVEELEETVHELRDKSRQLQEEVAVLTRERDLLQETFDQAQEEIHEIQEENDSLHDKLDDVTEEKLKIEDELIELKEESAKLLESAKAGRAEMKLKLETMQEEHTQMSVIFRKREEGHKELTDSVEALEEEREKLLAQIEEMEEAAETHKLELEAERGNINGELAMYKQKALSSKERLEEVRNQARSFREKAARLIQQAEEKAERAVNEQKLANEAVQRMKKEVMEGQFKSDDVQRQLEKKDDELNQKLLEMRRRVQVRNDQLVSEKELAVREKDEWERKFKSLQRESDEKLAQCQRDFRMEKMSLQEEVSRLRVGQPGGRQPQQSSYRAPADNIRSSRMQDKLGSIDFMEDDFSRTHPQPPRRDPFAEDDFGGSFHKQPSFEAQRHSAMLEHPIDEDAEYEAESVVGRPRLATQDDIYRGRRGGRPAMDMDSGPWVEVTDVMGRKHWRNTQTGETSMKDPEQLRAEQALNMDARSGSGGSDLWTPGGETPQDYGRRMPMTPPSRPKTSRAMSTRQLVNHHRARTAPHRSSSSRHMNGARNKIVEPMEDSALEALSYEGSDVGSSVSKSGSSSRRSRGEREERGERSSSKRSSSSRRRSSSEKGSRDKSKLSRHSSRISSREKDRDRRR